MLQAKCGHFAGDNHIGGDGALLKYFVRETIARFSVRATKTDATSSPL
jgi:hypothetical protein